MNVKSIVKAQDVFVWKLFNRLCHMLSLTTSIFLLRSARDITNILQSSLFILPETPCSYKWWRLGGKSVVLILVLFTRSHSSFSCSLYSRSSCSPTLSAAPAKTGPVRYQSSNGIAAQNFMCPRSMLEEILIRRSFPIEPSLDKRKRFNHTF